MMPEVRESQDGGAGLPSGSCPLGGMKMQPEEVVPNKLRNWGKFPIFLSCSTDGRPAESIRWPRAGQRRMRTEGGVWWMEGNVHSLVPTPSSKERG